MSVKKSIFGELDGKGTVELYKITNSSGASAEFMTLGAGIHAICVPDKNGVLGDVVLGFDKPEYYTDPDLGYQGLAVGRYANRIRDAKFSIDSKEYHTPVNQGSWTLHGGGRFSFNLWDAREVTANSVAFSRFSPDGEDGFPGNMTVNIKYTFDDDNVLTIEYTVLSDKKTVANPTNHSYFNLSCISGETIENHILKINADKFTETDKNQLTTGELGEVKGTMMDFTEAHRIGDRIDEPFRAVIDGVGYDNNYCLTKENPFEMSEAAVLYDEKSGRKLTVSTDMPGIQLYCGGWLKKSGNPGKGDSKVTFRRGVALETQFYPDALNKSEFPFRYVEPGREFKTVTKYAFSLA